jgi:HSP20 family molecular chaperone IbpA
MSTTGAGRRLPPHAQLREEGTRYVVELDVSDFTQSEVRVELDGPRVCISADQIEPSGEAEEPFTLHERLEESFLLPADADAGGVRAFYAHGTLELQIPRVLEGPRVVPIEARPAGLIHGETEPC